VEQRTNNTPISGFTEALAYFLAAAFSIEQGISTAPFNITNRVLFGVGVFLFLSSFLVVANIYWPQLITRLKLKLPKQLHRLAPLILYVVVAGESVYKVLGFAAVPPIFITGFIFLLFFILSFVFTFKNTTILILSFLANVAAVYFLLSRFQDTNSLVFLLSLSSIMVLLVAIRMLRPPMSTFIQRFVKKKKDKQQ
jgi:hypothetical protein